MQYASTELVQLVLTIFTGFIFGSVVYTPGWFITYVIIYEMVIYYLNRNSVYYRPYFRLVLNCTFFMSIIYGNWMLRDECSMDCLVYDKPMKDESLLSWVAELLGWPV